MISHLIAMPHDITLRAQIVICAILLDAIIGEPAFIWRKITHPVVIFGYAIGIMERLGNSRRMRGRTRRLLGGVAIVVLVVLAALSGGAIMAIVSSASTGTNIATILVEGVLVAILLAARSLDTHVRAVAGALAGKSLGLARGTLALIVGRDTQTLNPTAIARASIETTAENLSDGVIAPALFYLGFGLPGIFVYKMINTADSMTGYKSKDYYAWGWGAARLDDLANIVPSRLTGILIALAYPPRAIKAIGAMWRYAPQHRSPNAGWPESAMAAQLEVMLAGPRRYGKKWRNDAVIFEQGRASTAADVYSGLEMMWRAVAVFALGVLILTC